MTRAQRQSTPAPPLTHDEIMRRADAILSKYEAAVGRDSIIRDGMRFRDLYESVVYPDYEIELVEGVDLGVDADGYKILGVYDVEANTAFIDACIGPDSGDPRRTFTLHHEVLGHGVLQGAWLRKRLTDEERSPFVVTTEHSLSPRTIRELERQANAFAARTSAPPWLLDVAVFECFRPTKAFIYLGPTQYWLEAYGISRPYQVESLHDLCRCMALQVRRRFDDLSTESLAYRIADSSWVHDRTRRVELRRVAL